MFSTEAYVWGVLLGVFWTDESFASKQARDGCVGGGIIVPDVYESASEFTRSPCGVFFSQGDDGVFGLLRSLVGSSGFGSEFVFESLFTELLVALEPFVASLWADLKTSA